MQSPTIGARVRAATPTGHVTGKVVGSERRDVSRAGNGEVVPFLCIAPDPDQPNDMWLWLPAAAVEQLEA
jgi:hypothetical protein